MVGMKNKKKVICETVRYTVIRKTVDGKVIKNNGVHFKKRTYYIKDEN